MYAMGDNKPSRIDPAPFAGKDSIQAQMKRLDELLARLTERISELEARLSDISCGNVEELASGPDTSPQIHSSVLTGILMFCDRVVYLDSKICRILDRLDLL